MRRASLHVASSLFALALAACSAADATNDGRADGGAGGEGGGGQGGAAGAAGQGGAPPASVYPPAAGQGDITAGLAQLNAYRATLGLSQVTLDSAASTGCEGHLDYLIEESQKQGQTVLQHDEPDHQNSHYSPTNEQAGKDSDIAWGQDQNGGQSFGEAVDMWVNGVYHRLPVLDPGLTTIGAASKSGYNCLNYRSGTVAQVAASPILWPASGMTDVPLTFAGHEGPCPTLPANPLNTNGQDCLPAGFIVSAVWYGWGSWNQSAFGSVDSVTLSDVAGGGDVALLAYYADGISGHDPAPGYMPDEIAIVPQASLGANTVYRVDIAATVKGAPTNLSWQFTTGTRTE